MQVYVCVCVLPVTKRGAVAFGDLLHLVVVSQHKQRPLEAAHLVHLGHDVLVDAVHDLLLSQVRQGGMLQTHTEREREQEHYALKERCSQKDFGVVSDILSFTEEEEEESPGVL